LNEFGRQWISDTLAVMPAVMAAAKMAVPGSDEDNGDSNVDR
jgi:hypothetical protein